MLGSKSTSEEIKSKEIDTKKTAVHTLMDAQTPLRTAGLPAHILKTAFLVGKIPFRACRQDPRISYTLYIPPRQYCNVHDALEAQTDHAVIDRLPLVVNIHGTGRVAERCRNTLVEFADTHGIAVLAPLFPVALDGPSDLHSYKRLRSDTLRSDLVLLSILDEVKQIWPGISTEKVVMMGFSGGGQFVHRFMYIHPERVRAVIVGAPGSVTKLSGEKWPAGIGNIADTLGEVSLEVVRRIERVLLIVGDEDGDEAAAKYQEAMSWFVATGLMVGKGDVAGVMGGKGRLQTLRELQAHWRDQGIESELEIVPGVGHEYLGVLPVMLSWLSDYLPATIS